MTKLSLPTEVKRVAELLIKLSETNFNTSIKSEKKELNKNLKKVQIFLLNNTNKTINVRVKNSCWTSDETFLEFNRTLENSAAFLVDYYMIDNPNDKLAQKFAILGGKLENPHCLLVLSYMYAKGKFGVIANSKKAREFIERAVVAGGTDDINFATAKDAVLNCEQRSAAMRSAALIDRATGNGFMETLASFSHWLNDYTQNPEKEAALQENKRKGVVVEEQFGYGTQYVFYADDDSGRTRGERLKTFDVLTKTGETENGDKIKGQ